MSTKFAVHDNAVNQHSSNLDTSVSAMNGQASSFITAISSLPGVWKGTAYGSWDQLTQAWSQAMSDLNSSLTDIKDRVGNAGQLYDSYHADQTSQLQSTMASANWDGAKFSG